MLTRKEAAALFRREWTLSGLQGASVRILIFRL